MRYTVVGTDHDSADACGRGETVKTQTEIKPEAERSAQLMRDCGYRKVSIIDDQDALLNDAKAAYRKRITKDWEDGPDGNAVRKNGCSSLAMDLDEWIEKRAADLVAHYGHARACEMLTGES